MLHREGDDLAPVLLRLLDGLLEVRVEQQVIQRALLGEGFGDLLEEARADDATTAPDLGDLTEVELPLVLVLGLAHELEALGVGADLGAVEGVADLFDDLGAVRIGHRALRATEDLGGFDALILHGGEAAGEDGFGDGRSGDAHVEGVGARPLARALLAGGVEDDVDQRDAGLGVLLLEHLGGDLDEEGVQVALVPFFEGGADLVRGHAEEAAHEVVGFADHLHVAVLDAVVDHLDVVASAVGADMGHAGDTTLDGLAGGRAGEFDAGDGIYLRGDGFPDGLQFGPGGSIATRHEGRTKTGAFFAAGDAGADEAEALGLQLFLAADGVRPEGVAAVDDDVARLESRGELVDHRVGRAAGLDEDDRFAGLLEGGREVLDGGAAGELARGLRVFLHELVGLGGRTVIHRDREAVVGDVEGEVLTHDGQTDETNVGLHKRSQCEPPSAGMANKKRGRFRLKALVFGTAGCLSPRLI